MKVRIRFRSVGKDYPRDWGFKQTDDLENWRCVKSGYHIFETPDGDFPIGIVDSIARKMNSLSAPVHHALITTEDIETGKKIAGCCVIRQSSGKYEPRTFFCEEEEE